MEILGKGREESGRRSEGGEEGEERGGESQVCTPM